MKTENKNPVGRPKTVIDPDDLRRICLLNCTMPEIAAYLRIPLRTLEDRISAEPELKEIIQSGREQGKLSVRRKQFQIMDEENSATMAIWLGKQLLGQRDKHDLVTEDKSGEKLSEALNIVSQIARSKVDEENA
tara:strand:+ start:57 stop:458 length:402 start_codon:yes stop_codon:yes gene_type:complete